MRFGSLFSGIDAASVAWLPLGWTCEWLAEIEKFPSAVLAHHYPTVPNLGDVTKVDWDEVRATRPVDLIVFGSPCQSYSIAGQRLGLADPRGNLALIALGVVARFRPKWFLFENVPGLLSSGEGRDFGAFLATVGDIGYQCAWRVLDAQYFGVAQRRNRVFVVGCLGGWAPAAAVLFERACLRGDSAPSRETWEDVAGTIGSGSAGRGWSDDLDRSGAFIPETVSTLTASHDASPGGPGDGFPVVVTPIAEVNGDRRGRNKKDGLGIGEPGDPQFTVLRGKQHGVFIANAEGSEDISLTASCGVKGVNNQTPLVAFDEVQITNPNNRSNPAPGGPAPTISKNSRMMLSSGFDWKKGGAKATDRGLRVTTGRSVRRLTPIEYEILFGFPRNYTRISPTTADGPRYRALGNSIAVPVLAWIGRRIDAVDRILGVKR